MDPVELLREALGIYSPTTKERPLALFLCREMKALGYSSVRIDKAGNALGEIGEGDCRILLCGHMDTVPGELPVRASEGYLFGRGASDAKSALCSMLLAGSKAADAGARVTFAGATREEGDGLGIQSLVKSPRRVDFAVFGEPSGSNRVTIGYRGRVGVHMSLKTQGGHAGSPWAHVSAVDEFYGLLASLKSYEAELTVNGDHFRSLSITPTLVKAGSFHNVVPGECDATFDVRVPPGSSCASVKASLERILREVELKNPGSTHLFDESTEPYEADSGSTLVRAFQRAILVKLGVRPMLVKKTGTGDMNTFAVSRPVQCVTYGPGDAKLSHTKDEKVSVEDYTASIEVLAEAIRQVTALARKSS